MITVKNDSPYSARIILCFSRENYAGLVLARAGGKREGGSLEPIP